MASDSLVAELLIGGWGDFDADQLLHEDSGVLDPERLLAFSPVHEGGPEEPQEAVGASPRAQVTVRKRNSVPLIVLPREGGNHSPGFPSLSRSTKIDTPSSRSRPPTQVLRQRVLEVEDFAAVRSGSSSASIPAASPTTAELRKRLPRLPSHSGGGPESSAVDTAPLFGVFMADTMEMRTTIFGHFRRLWLLMSSRPTSREDSRQAEELKSPFECSMALLKLCKAVGISLPPNAALSSTVPFWHGKSRDVEFTSFCEYVVRHAIQPAVEHFKLDGTMDEYVACIQAIVQSVLFPPSENNNEGKGDSSSARLRELGEIQPVFPSWTAGIASLTKDKRAKSDPEQQIEAAAASESAAYALRREAGMRLRLADQAKATHEANIQRKVRLHKSWQPRAVGTPGLVVSDDRPMNVQYDRQANESCLDDPSSQRIDGRHFDARALERVETAAPPAASSEPVEPDDSPNQESDDLLLCGVCTARDAMLWCSSCFAVYCLGCWQDVHHTVADISHVTSSQADQLQGPLSRQLKKQENDVVPPPVAMLYLPVKPLQPGKRIKGTQCAHAKPQQSPEKPFGSHCAAVSAVNDATNGIAHALLPALSRASLANDGSDHHRDAPHTDSAADLLKKLMQSAASNHSTGTSGATRQYKDPKKRVKLHPASVTLDASLLFGPES